MEPVEQINTFKELLELSYRAELLEAVRKGQNYFQVDFNTVLKHSPDLAEDIIEDPEEVLAAAEHAVKEMVDLPPTMKKFYLRFHSLPQSTKLILRDVRSKHLKKFMWTLGVVRQKSDVRPQVTSMRFECPSCGNIINVLQLDKKLKEPTRCGCGRKGKFNELSKELIDGQGLVLEEASEDLDGGEQPKRLNVFLKNDLVSPFNDKKTSPGSKIQIVGWVTEVPITLRTGGQATNFDLLIEANNVIASQEDFSEVKITPEDEEEIKTLAAKPDVEEQLVDNLAVSIYGYQQIKQALLYQLVGGVRKVRADGSVSRGDMHVLLIGDPGAGKSMLLKRMVKIAPKGRYVSGKGASAAGLTAAVVKDEFLGGWSLEAGAMVLANKGFCMIDEMDKMSKEDRSALHEGMEQQTISISKANIQATLRCETTVLAAANPKYGRFDPYEHIVKQIDLPPALINRFDLIFTLKDLPDQTKDSNLAEHVLGLHRDPDKMEQQFSTEFIRKYISYARQLKPTISQAAFDKIKNYYVHMRNTGNDEGGIKSIPISPRQLEALIRLSEASAKIRFSLIVEEADAQRAIDLLEYCLGQVAKDSETGKIDIDLISTGISSASRNKIIRFKEAIKELESQIGEKIVPIDDLIEIAKDKDFSEDEAEEMIQKLKRAGDIFEPKRGFIQRM